MNMKEAVISVLANWNNFRGRACRSEFWYFYLASFLSIVVIVLFEMVTGIYDFINDFGPLSTILQLVLLVPTIAVTSRRIQDAGFSGWWQLSYITIIGIFVVFVWTLFPATEDENKWGRNPLLDKRSPAN